ncbi:MAG: glycoside hydrolase family 2, partial [Alistipes sp.]|nr:glycoside hydrolase family 2 [Alistipes sp.]
MKKLLFPILAMLVTASCQKAQSPRTIEDFNFDWCFTLGDDEAFASPDFDDSDWRELHLPHDWSIEGEFSKDNPSTPSGGALPGGIGWYRKHFATPADIADRRVNVEFDGIFMNSTVYVNGHEAGYRPYGYSSLSYDITPYLTPEVERKGSAVRCHHS